MALGGTDLNLLHALKVLLEEANVTHAARRMNVRQPAMSVALSRLRRQFGDELLVRRGRAFELTPLGAQLLPTVQEAQRLLNAALMVGEQFDPATTTRVFRFAMSDYSMSVVFEPLMRRITAQAPHCTVEFDPIRDNDRGPQKDMIDHDLLIGPMGGYGLPGVGKTLFDDRMVCLADRNNPHLRDGRLTLADLSELPLAMATFGYTHPTPADRVLGEMGVTPHIQALVAGWLAIPYIVENTNMVAVVPGRLARQVCTENTTLVTVEPPFGEFPLVEGYWSQDAKLAEPAQRWLMTIVEDVAQELATDHVGGPIKRAPARPTDPKLELDS